MSMRGIVRKGGGALEAPITHYSIITWERDHVRASVIELHEGAAELMGVAAAPVHGVGRASHPDVDRWYAGCEKALTQAEDMTLGSRSRKLVPDYAMMSVPAEITRALPVTVAMSRRQPDAGVTPEELLALLQRGYRKAQDILGVRSKGAAEDMIAGSVVETTLDGQPVAEPVGLRGQQLQLQLTFFLAPLEWIRALEIVAERLQLALTGIAPQHVVCAAALADPLALLILLDEQYTVVSQARQGQLEWSALQEVGERQMTLATTQTLGLQGRQADALMRAYRARQLQDDAELQVARSFWGELRRWMTSLAEAARPNLGNAFAPHRIYFLDLTRRIPEAQRALETPFWERTLPFERCPAVSELGVQTVRDVLDRTTQANGPSYLALRALAHYVAQLYGPGPNLNRALLDIMHGKQAMARGRS